MPKPAADLVPVENDPEPTSRGRNDRMMVLFFRGADREQIARSSPVDLVNLHQMARKHSAKKI
jgi:hypothetical protein